MIKDDFQESKTTGVEGQVQTQPQAEDGKVIVQKVKKKSKISKKTALIIGGVVLGVGLVSLGVVYKNSTKDNFYTYTQSILSNQKGEYSYVIDVRTAEHSEKSSEEEISVDEISEYNPEDEISASDKKIEKDSMESIIESTGQKQATENAEWGNAEGIKDGYWKYPNYRVTISGCTNDTENVEAYTKINLATDYYQGDFTEIVEKEGKTYLNVGLIKTWLTQSGDAYLVSLAEGLPQSAYVEYDKFELSSRYTDKVTEGYTTMQLKNANLASSIIKTISNNMGKTGLSKADKDAYNLTIAEDGDSKKFAGVMKSLVTGVGGVYKSYLGEGCTDEDTKNILTSFEDIITLCSNLDLSTTNFKVSGKASKFLTSSGNTSLASNFGVSFTLDDVDYTIKANLSRTGVAGDVAEPTDTVIQFDGTTTISDTLDAVTDYFNPILCIEPRAKDMTNETILENALSDFAETVNKAGCYEHHLSILNVQDYIQTYMNGEDGDENTELVKGFLETMNTLTGGLVVEKQVEQEVVEEKYPSVTGKINKMEILSGGYKKKGSTKGLIHVQLLVLNKNKYDRPYDLSSEVTVTPDALDTTKFTVSDSKKTETNANNEVLLRAYDNNWDMTKSPTVVYINPEGYSTIDLYFTADEFKGKVNLFYDGDSLGTIVAY